MLLTTLGTRADDAIKYAAVVEEIPYILYKFDVFPKSFENNNDDIVITNGINGDGNEGEDDNPKSSTDDIFLTVSVGLYSGLGLLLVDLIVFPTIPVLIVLNIMPITINNDSLNSLSLIKWYFRGKTTNGGTKNNGIHIFKFETTGKKKLFTIFAFFDEIFSILNIDRKDSIIILSDDGKAIL